MPTRIIRPPAAQLGTAGPGSRDGTSTSVTALAIIATLVLILHIAAGEVLAHPLAAASTDMPKYDAACLGEMGSPVSSLPFD